MQKNFHDPFFCNNNDLQASEAMYLHPLHTNRHIQILLKPLGINAMSIHHWVCSFYNGQQIFIYDSLSIKTGHSNYELVLGNLFPNYFENNASIVFPEVHIQEGSLDCGVYAIANAVALHFGLNPEELIYDSIINLRKHLASIYLTEVITPFPVKETLIENGDLKGMDVDENYNKRKAKECIDLKREKRRKAYENQKNNKNFEL